MIGDHGVLYRFGCGGCNCEGLERGQEGIWRPPPLGGGGQEGYRYLLGLCTGYNGGSSVNLVKVELLVDK